MTRARSFARTIRIAPLLVSLAVVGCAGRPLQVSPGVAESTVELSWVKVDRRSWNFGDYYVREIRRGWDRGGTVSVGAVSASQKSRNFSFAITHAALSMQVRCELTASAVGVGGVTVSDGEQILCDLNPSDATTPWKVVLVERNRREIQGRLQQGARELPLVAAHGQGFLPSRGYLVREQGDIAAVDVGRKTRTLWLPKTASPHEGLALAAAGIIVMLLEEVS